MEKTLFESNSRRSSRRHVTPALLLALAIPFLDGCAYSRIALTGRRNEAPENTVGSRLHVVDFIVETHDGSGKVREQSISDVGRTLSAVDTNWFSTDSSAVPIVVKSRVDLLSTGGTTPGDPVFWTCLAGSLSLGTIPMYWRSDLRLGLYIQLGPGEWSDSRMIPGQEDVLIFNPASALLFSWVLPESSGWQRGAGGAADLLPYLREGSGEFRINQGFATILAEQIVCEWNNLSLAERRKALKNPVAIRKKQELRPWAEEATTRTAVEISRPSEPVAVSEPVLVSSSYDKSTRRGSISFRRNGAEPLTALRWARETVVPRIVGPANIRILREDTRTGGVTTIEFEVLP